MSFHRGDGRLSGNRAKLGRAAQKPASGRLMLRVPPEVYTAALVAAQVSGQSLNQWATQALQRAAE
jgi:predicted HicB family RNase H-like nuclease